MDREPLKKIVKRRVDSFTLITIMCFGMAAGFVTAGEIWCYVVAFILGLFGIGALNGIGDMCVEQAALLDELAEITNIEVAKREKYK